MLDFVEEPEIKGKSGERRFQVSEQQIDELKKTIVSSMSSIRALQFRAPPTSKSVRNATSSTTVTQMG
jgi:hypothetical protein